jgi:hypothetical protein
MHPYSSRGFQQYQGCGKRHHRLTYLNLTNKTNKIPSFIDRWGEWGINVHSMLDVININRSPNRGCEWMSGLAFTMKLDKILHNIRTKEKERSLGEQKVPMKILRSMGCALFLNLEPSSFKIKYLNCWFSFLNIFNYL